MPKLLIKNHTLDTKEKYPTQLVIPDTNFIATFSKVEYLALKALLDKNNVDYSKFTITQASDLRCHLEKLKFFEIENSYLKCCLHVKKFYVISTKSETKLTSSLFLVAFFVLLLFLMTKINGIIDL